MKAKYFKRIRDKVQYYTVEVSEHLFGDLYSWRYGKNIVLAYSHQHAANRFKKRKGISKLVGDETSEQWGRYRVKIADKPNHHRHYKYY